VKSSRNQSLVIIIVGLVGCLLTSMAGIASVMYFRGWAASGGWQEWLNRLSIAYPAASVVVLAIFPWLVPRLSDIMERLLERTEQMSSQ